MEGLDGITSDRNCYHLDVEPMNRLTTIALVAGAAGAAAFAGYKLTGGGASSTTSTTPAASTSSTVHAAAGGSEPLCSGTALTTGPNGGNISLSSPNQSASFCAPGAASVTQISGSSMTATVAAGRQIVVTANSGAKAGDAGLFVITWKNPSGPDGTATLALAVVA